MNKIEVIIKRYKGETFTLEINSSDTALDLRQQIEKRTGLPAGNFRLILDGRQLLKEELSGYNVQNGTVFNVIG